MVPHFGGLTGTGTTVTLQDPLPEIVRKVNVTEDGVEWSNRITLPYEPFIGTIGTAPQINSVKSLTSGNPVAHLLPWVRYPGPAGCFEGASGLGYRSWLYRL